MQFLFSKFTKDKFLHRYFASRVLKEYLWKYAFEIIGLNYEK